MGQKNIKLTFGYKKIDISLQINSGEQMQSHTRRSESEETCMERRTSVTPQEILKQYFGYDTFHPGQEERENGIII